MGYSVKWTGGKGDEGVDLTCHRNSSSEVIIVQCKRFRGKVGVGTVRDFYGTLIDQKAMRGYVVSTGEFTEGARRWTRDKPIELINIGKLTDLLLKYG